MTTAFGAFCVNDSCMRYLSIELDDLNQAHEIRGKKCPHCPRGTLVCVIPPYYTEELHHGMLEIHKGLNIYKYNYIFDGVKHFMYIVNEHVVFFVGYSLDPHNLSWLYCMPTAPRTIDGHEVRWDEFELKVDGDVIYSPKLVMEQQH
jgi:hypothetical protein